MVKEVLIVYKIHRYNDSLWLCGREFVDVVLIGSPIAQLKSRIREVEVAIADRPAVGHRVGLCGNRGPRRPCHEHQNQPAEARKQGMSSSGHGQEQDGKLQRLPTL